MVASKHENQSFYSINKENTETPNTSKLIAHG